MIAHSLTRVLLTTCLVVACSAHDDATATPSSPSNPSGEAAPGAGAKTSDTPEGTVGSQATPLKLRRTLGIVIYRSFEVLDAYGPAEMFHYVGLPLNVVWVAEKAGPVTSVQGTQTVADFGFDDAPPLDMIMVPGGIGTVPELIDSKLIEFLKTRAKDAELVLSVCTGSAILARAGLLDGYKATSNKRFFSLARVAGPNVNWIEKARWVEDRDRITSSGVSAGMDMSLAVISRLWGEEKALKIAHDTEYTWQRDSTVDPFFEK